MLRDYCFFFASGVTLGTTYSNLKQGQWNESLILWTISLPPNYSFSVLVFIWTFKFLLTLTNKGKIISILWVIGDILLLIVSYYPLNLHIYYRLFLWYYVFILSMSSLVHWYFVLSSLINILSISTILLFYPCFLVLFWGQTWWCTGP